MQQRYHYRFEALVIALFLLSSCARDFDNLNWNTVVSAPIAKTTLTLDNLYEDDTLIQKNSDNSLSLVYRSEIYTFSTPLDSLVNIQIRPLVKDVTLASLELAGQDFSSSISLGDLLGDNFFFRLLFPDQTWVDNDFGSTSFSVPVDPINVDFSNIIQTAILNEGRLTIRLENNLPLDIRDLVFTIRNTVGNQIIYQDSYVLNSGDVLNQEIDIAAELNGEAIEGRLTVEFGNVTVSPPTGPDSIFVDYSDNFLATISLSNLKVQEAYAIFPAQNIVEAKDTVGLEGMGDIELTRAKIKRGRITAKVSSTVENEMHIEYFVPSAVLNGNMFQFEAEVPAAPVGGSYTFYEEFLYDGYDFDFTGKDGTLTNTFYNELYARIDSTGKIVHLSLEDTISLEIKVEELIPSYVEGYMGQQNIDIAPDTIEFDVFSRIRSGSLSFESAKLSVSVTNGLGLDAVLNFNQLTALNTRTNQRVDFPSIPDFTIQEATNTGSGFIESSQSFEVPDAVSILNILPNKIFYNLSGQLNPGGNVPPYRDFVYEAAQFNAFLDLEVPFSFNASKLVLTDTLEFEEENIASPEEIENGILRLVVTNGFPLEAKLRFYMLDEFNTITDSLISTNPIQAATVQAGKVISRKESIVEYYVDKTRLDHFLTSKSFIIETEFNTPSTGFTKLYTDYAMDIILVTEFKYKAGSGL